MDDGGEVSERQGQAYLNSPTESNDFDHGAHRGSPRRHVEEHRPGRVEESARRRESHTSSRSSRANDTTAVNRDGETFDRRESTQRRERSPIDRSRSSRATKSENRLSGRTRARSRSRSPLARTDKHGPSHTSKTDNSRRARHSPVHQSPREDSHRGRPPSPSSHWSNRRMSAGEETRHKSSSADHTASQQRPPSPARTPPPPPPAPVSVDSAAVPQVYSVPATYSVTGLPSQSGTFVYNTPSGQQVVAEMLSAGSGAHVVAPGATYMTAGASQPMPVSARESLDSTARHGSSTMPMQSQQVTVIQNAQSMPLATPPPQQADALLGLLQRYPVMWQGHLALKNDVAAVQMHFLSGSQRLAQIALPQPGTHPSTATLRIAQRMRLEQSQLDGVARRMQVSMLAALS